MARGGKRQGKPGGNYANRSDMRTTQPVQAPSGGQYGERKAAEDAQRQMPLENTQGVQAQQAMAAQQGGGTFPGDLPALDRPTERPQEPVTAGAAIGAGPNTLAPPTNPDTADAERLRGYMPMLEALANLPTTSDASRNFVRRLRAAIPIQDENA